jgi:hypothetical protein
MAVQYDEATASALSDLLTATRDALGDEDAAAANQRWSDARIFRALNLEIKKFQLECNLHETGPWLSSVSLTYTADSETVTLPEQARTHPIVRVEDVTSAAIPIEIPHISHFTAERYNENTGDSLNRRNVFSVLGDAIALRPKPANAISLRLWTVRSPYVFDAVADTTNQLPLYPGVEEVFSLGAAIRLQETDEEISEGRVARYLDLFHRAVKAATRFRGLRYVGNNRRYK